MRFSSAHALSTRALLTMLAALVVAVAGAQPPPAQPGGEPLTLRGAIARALANRAELAGFVFELRAHDARIAEAGLRPPLEAELLVEDVAGSGDRSGLDAAQSTLSLGYVLELGGKRDARVAAAESARSRARTERAAAQLDVTADVARRFVETLRDQERLAIAQQNVELKERTRAAVEQRVRAARSPEVELARAEVRLAQARLAREDAEHELSSSRNWLAAAMGSPRTEFADVEGELLLLEDPAPLETLLARLDATPEIARFAAEQRLRDSELRLAELRRRPDIRGTFGVRHYAQGDDAALIAGFSVPLGTSRRAQASIDAAKASGQQVALDREARLFTLQAQLYAQYQELAHGLHEARALNQEILPKLSRALEQTAYAYERGRYSLLEWIDAQREYLDARSRLVEVAAAVHILRVEIERLTGESLERAGERR